MCCQVVERMGIGLASMRGRLRRIVVSGCAWVGVDGRGDVVRRVWARRSTLIVIDGRGGDFESRRRVRARWSARRGTAGLVQLPIRLLADLGTVVCRLAAGAAKKRRAVGVQRRFAASCTFGAGRGLSNGVVSDGIPGGGAGVRPPINLANIDLYLLLDLHCSHLLPDLDLLLRAALGGHGCEYIEKY